MTGHCGDSSSQGYKQKSRTTILMSVKRPKADVPTQEGGLPFGAKRDILRIVKTLEFGWVQALMERSIHLGNTAQGTER